MFLWLGLYQTTHLPWIVCLLLALAISGLLGVVIDVICFRPIRNVAEPEATAALTTVVFGMILTDLTTKVWGTEPVPLPPSMQQFGYLTIHFGTLSIPVTQILIVGVGLIVMLLLDLALFRTHFGRTLRAVSQAPVTCQLAGIKTSSVILKVFVFSSVLAGLAGILFALRIGSVTPDVGLDYGLKALSIVAIAGLGQIRGAMFVGVCLGILEGVFYQIGLGSYVNLIVWLLLILILILKPNGLFGQSREVRT
jgi:branched-chain amino acid transport system permease protein